MSQLHLHFHLQCYCYYYCIRPTLELFKGNIAELPQVPERRGGAHMGLPECIDTVLNWTELYKFCYTYRLCSKLYNESVTVHSLLVLHLQLHAVLASPCNIIIAWLCEMSLPFPLLCVCVCWSGCSLCSLWIPPLSVTCPPSFKSVWGRMHWFVQGSVQRALGRALHSPAVGPAGQAHQTGHWNV